MTDPTRDPRSVSATVGESPSTLGPLWVAVASAVFVSAVLAWWVAHAGLQAVFGPIDDHEPLFWMGAERPPGDRRVPEHPAEQHGSR